MRRVLPRTRPPVRADFGSARTGSDGSASRRGNTGSIDCVIARAGERADPPPVHDLAHPPPPDPDDAACRRLVHRRLVRIRRRRAPAPARRQQPFHRRRSPAPQSDRRAPRGGRPGTGSFATLLTCSDSRVPAETIFDQGLGDLFVVRVAGNVAKTDEIGSIEYGAAHLGTSLLVVMGHSSCGAVKAVVEGAEVHGNIPQLVDTIVPAVEKTKAANPGLPGAQLLARAVEANVWQSIDGIFENSATIRELVKAGKLKVVGAVYDLATGAVEIKGEHPEQARLLAATGGAGAHAAAESEPVATAASENHPTAAPRPPPRRSSTPLPSAPSSSRSGPRWSRSCSSAPTASLARACAPGRSAGA
ncbi:carbonic anhydrase [Oleiharenicola sp. Vm1]|uniref:carbonic anhydrase n=1 Tax=Oleiharenicola sp. Vm1 TaxID=3398393 RepID=UPI0039F5A227